MLQMKLNNMQLTTQVPIMFVAWSHFVLHDNDIVCSKNPESLYI